MKKKDRESIDKILCYCNKMDSHIEYFGDDESLFLENEHFQDACALVIIQIGEYVSRLSDEFKEEYSDIPWNEIKYMRNLHAHNYESVMYDIVWVTMKRDIPELKEYLESII